MRQGWKLGWRPGGEAVLTLPESMSQAPDEIRQALTDWVLLAMRRRPDKVVKTQKRKLENRVHAWIHQHNETDPRKAKQASGRAARRLERLQPQGKHHDLGAIFEQINRDYFHGKLEAKITWSSRWGGLSTQSVRKDAGGKSYHLLSISRGYDHPSATAEIVGGVVYHECLHIALPPQESGDRRTIHSREFKKREKEYRHYDAWMQWHKEMLPKILRRKPIS